MPELVEREITKLWDPARDVYYYRLRDSPHISNK
jgi:hypothetical protein